MSQISNILSKTLLFFFGAVVSKLDELASRPPTIIFTSRVDDRHLATLALFWRSKGEMFTSVSALARLSLETFAEFLVQNNLADFVSTHSAALEILENTGLKPERVNPRNLAKALVAEGYSFSPSSSPVDRVHQEQRQKSPFSKDNPALRAAEEELRKRLADQMNQQIERTNDDLSEFKSQFGNKPND